MQTAMLGIGHRWTSLPHPLACSTIATGGVAWQWMLCGEVHSTTDAQNRLVRSAELSRLEAVLFLADSPLSIKKLADAGKLIDTRQCRELIEQLNELYDTEDSPFRIEQVASGVQLLTRPEYSHWLDRIHQRNVELKLTPPALETLTIIAYRQPMTRADVEAIRGVQCSEVIKQLIDRQLIRIGGEEDSLGRPYLYETTKQFLQYMGIRRIDQLPDYAELRAEANKAPQAEPDEATTAPATEAAGVTDNDSPAPESIADDTDRAD